MGVCDLGVGGEVSVGSTASFVADDEERLWNDGEEFTGYGVFAPVVGFFVVGFGCCAAACVVFGAGMAFLNTRLLLRNTTM